MPLTASFSGPEPLKSRTNSPLYRRPDLQVGRPSRNAETHIRKREAELTQKKRRAAP